jgi:hypothetical protein
VSINKLLLLTLMVFFSCSKQPILPGFDSQKWQDDADGCDSQRIQLVDEVLNRKAELAGLGQNEIVEIFGKPNRHELYSRNKKAFVYFVGGGPDCIEQKEIADKLVIRFNGIGRLKEIILYKN